MPEIVLLSLFTNLYNDQLGLRATLYVQKILEFRLEIQIPRYSIADLKITFSLKKKKKKSPVPTFNLPQMSLSNVFHHRTIKTFLILIHSLLTS